MSPIIEVWLTRRGVGMRCMVVRDDETTELVPVRSFSMRGAQREITTRFASSGCVPAARWAPEARHGGNTTEASRLFRGSVSR